MAEGKSSKARVAEKAGRYRRLRLPSAETERLALLGRLTGGVVHDFRNLLTAILLFADLLENGSPQESASARYVGEIRAAVRRGDELIAHLLGWARQQNPKPQLISVDTLLTDIRDMLQRLMGADVVLTLRCCAPASVVQVDSAQIEQIILNLAINARDAMVDGGQLTIETSEVRLDGADVRHWPGIGAKLQPGTYLKLEVKDIGCGMDETTRARAFEPFFTTKAGTGLGLSTVHAIITQIGGSIAIDSALRSGTTVSVLLPMVKQQAAPAATAPQPGQARIPGGSETILLVEGDAAIRTATAHMLEECGYRVLAAGDGKEALRMARRNNGIQLVMTDMTLPGERGDRVARQVCRLLPEARLLFLGMDDLYGRKLRQIGQQTLKKPFSKAALAGRVRKLLDDARLENLANPFHADSVGVSS